MFNRKFLNIVISILCHQFPCYWGNCPGEQCQSHANGSHGRDKGPALLRSQPELGTQPTAAGRRGCGPDRRRWHGRNGASHC